MKKLFTIIMLCIVVLFSPIAVFAHPGRTDANGGHTCRTNCEKWGLQYGQYHYHNGGSSSSSSGGGNTYSNGNPFIMPAEVEHHYYNVFVNGTLYKVVDGYQAAIDFAMMLNHAVIQDANSYEVMWDNIHTQVFQYGKYVNDFGSRKGAIDWAQSREYSQVIDTDTKEILWHNYPYTVYQGETYLDWFHKKDDAINYAKQWANSKVVDSLTYKVVWPQ